MWISSELGINFEPNLINDVESVGLFSWGVHRWSKLRPVRLAKCSARRHRLNFILHSLFRDHRQHIKSNQEGSVFLGNSETRWDGRDRSLAASFISQSKTGSSIFFLISKVSRGLKMYEKGAAKSHRMKFYFF